MIEKLLAEMEDYLEEDEYNEKIAKIVVKQAIESFVTKKNYKASSYTTDKILKDMEENYFYCIFDLAIYKYNKYGIEGQTSDRENDRTRTYGSEVDIYINHGVVPFVG